MSGVERGGTLRFLTLTSSNQSPDLAQHSFSVLYKRLRRRGLLVGYIKVPELSKNGKQHLHVLFRGKYIEQAIISHWWNEIHQAKVIDIRLVTYRRTPHRVASYMAKYMSKGNLWRYSWNWDWVWRGFVKDWTRLKRLVRQTYGEITDPIKNLLIHCWHLWLRGKWKPDFSLLLDAP